MRHDYMRHGTTTCSLPSTFSTARSSDSASFALDFDEQKRSGFRYHYYQIGYSRNLVCAVGGHIEQVLQSPIDRSRVPMDLKTIKIICGSGISRFIVDEPSDRSNGK